MKNDITSSCITVPVPTDLYLRMLDLQGSSNREGGPAQMVSSILQKFLDDAGSNLPGQGSSAKESAPYWSDEWIMFGSPPPRTKVKAPRSVKKSSKPQSADWCIGCACPSEDLLSS